MRSFENRADTAVWDEPFYAAYLAATGIDHPMRAAILRACECDPDIVARACLEAPVGPATVSFQKHMTHHMVAAIPRDWMDGVTNAFLIRRPEAVVASYDVKRPDAGLDDLGFVQQRALFERVVDRRGAVPPVIDADALRCAPEATLRALCRALDLTFDPAMLAWHAGPRPSDGIWARHWYDAVHRSTGFTPPTPLPALDDAQKRLADAARPAYDAMARHLL